MTLYEPEHVEWALHVLERHRNEGTDITERRGTLECFIGTIYCRSTHKPIYSFVIRDRAVKGDVRSRVMQSIGDNSIEELEKFIRTGK